MITTTENFKPEKINRIVIIGCSGSGKSTMAKNLSVITGLPIVHLDSIFWLPNWTERDKAEFDFIVCTEAQKDRWIIDGNYSRTLDERLKRCDMAIFLDLPMRVCMFSIIKRYLQNIGKTREDIGAGCVEKIDLPFLKWVWNFNITHRAKLIGMLEKYSDKNIIVLRKRKDCKLVLDQLQKQKA